MEPRNVGKVSVTVEDSWDKSKEYSKLSIVTTANGTYISKKYVPKYIDISNEEYWMNMKFENSSSDFYKIPGDITQLISGSGDDAINKIEDVFGTNDGWILKTITQKNLIDKNGIITTYKVVKTISAYIFYISYSNNNFINVELIAEEEQGSGSPKLIFKSVKVNINNKIENGCIVLPDKTCMSKEEYIESKRSDAIGVVFDKNKGLFVRKDIYNGILVNNETNVKRIFYETVGCKYPYDGKSTQKLNLLLSSNPASDFPVFNYAENNNLYVASNGELELISKVLDSLDTIGSNYTDIENISSCTQNPKNTSIPSVFYKGSWYNPDINDPTTNLNYFLVDVL